MKRLSIALAGVLIVAAGCGTDDATSEPSTSLADEAVCNEVRLAALEVYESWMPFESARREGAAETIARQSLARAHRWRGGDPACSVR